MHDFKLLSSQQQCLACPHFLTYTLPCPAFQREMFEKDVYSSYQDFVGKAAFCRNFTWDQANEVAQGRCVRQALWRIKDNAGQVLSSLWWLTGH